MSCENKDNFMPSFLPNLYFLFLPYSKISYPWGTVWSILNQNFKISLGSHNWDREIIIASGKLDQGSDNIIRILSLLCSLPVLISPARKDLTLVPWHIWTNHCDSWDGEFFLDKLAMMNWPCSQGEWYLFRRTAPPATCEMGDWHYLKQVRQ